MFRYNLSLYVWYSVCSEHAWKIRKFDPSKRSIFSLSQEACDSCDEGEECDSGEPCEESESCDSSEPREESVICDSSEAGGEGGVTTSSSETIPQDKMKKLKPSVTSRLARTFVTCGGNASSL